MRTTWILSLLLVVMGCSSSETNVEKTTTKPKSRISENTKSREHAEENPGLEDFVVRMTNHKESYAEIKKIPEEDQAKREQFERDYYRAESQLVEQYLNSDSNKTSDLIELLKKWRDSAKVAASIHDAFMDQNHKVTSEDTNRLLDQIFIIDECSQKIVRKLTSE